MARIDLTALARRAAPLYPGVPAAAARRLAAASQLVVGGPFVVLPLCIDRRCYSFLPIDDNGNATPGFTWDNYIQLNDPLYIHIFWRSILMSL